MSKTSSFPAPSAALLPLAHVSGLSSNLATISVNGLCDLFFVSFPNFITVGISGRMLFLEPMQQYKEYNKNTARVQYICYPEGFSFCKDSGNSTSWESSLIYWSSNNLFFTFHLFIVGGHMGHCTLVGPKGNLQESVFSFHCVGSKDRTQVIWFSDKYLCPQSHITDSTRLFLKNM